MVSLLQDYLHLFHYHKFCQTVSNDGHRLVEAVAGHALCCFSPSSQHSVQGSLGWTTNSVKQPLLHYRFSVILQIFNFSSGFFHLTSLRESSRFFLCFGILKESSRFFLCFGIVHKFEGDFLVLFYGLRACSLASKVS